MTPAEFGFQLGKAAMDFTDIARAGRRAANIALPWGNAFANPVAPNAQAGNAIGWMGRAVAGGAQQFGRVAGLLPPQQPQPKLRGPIAGLNPVPRAAAPVANPELVFNPRPHQQFFNQFGQPIQIPVMPGGPGGGVQPAPQFPQW